MLFSKDRRTSLADPVQLTSDGRTQTLLKPRHHEINPSMLINQANLIVTKLGKTLFRSLKKREVILCGTTWPI